MNTKIVQLGLITFIIVGYMQSSLAQIDEKPTLAMPNFSNIWLTNQQNIQLTERLLSEVEKTGKYRVIGRTERDSLAKQNGLEGKAPVKTQELLQWGQRLSAQKVLDAKMDLGFPECKFSARIFDTYTKKKDIETRRAYKGSFDGLLHEMKTIVIDLTDQKAKAPIYHSTINKSYAGICGLTGLFSLFEAGLLWTGTPDSTKEDKGAGWRIANELAVLSGFCFAGMIYFGINGRRYYQMGISPDYQGYVMLTPTPKLTGEGRESVIRNARRRDLAAATAWTSTFMTILSTSIVYEHNKYYNYKIAKDPLYQRNERLLSSWRNTRNAFAGIALVSSGAWFYFTHKEKHLLEQSLKSENQPHGRGRFQFGLIPAQKSTWGVKPGIEYTRTF